MAKLTVSDVYDISQVSDSKSYEDLATFIDYQIDFTKDVVQSYFNGLTISENLKRFTYDLSLSHGQTITLPLNSPYTLSNIESLYAIRCYTLSRTTTNTVSLTVWFDEVIDIVSDSAIWVGSGIIKYRIKDASIFKINDVVRTTEFTTQANNITGQVMFIDVPNNILYVSNYQRFSATADETKSSFGGTFDKKRDIKITFIL